MIKKVLLSVSDKTRITELARILVQDFNCEIYASTGSVKILQTAGILVHPVSDITGNPECFDGRMKTISFELGAGLLYRRGVASDVETARQLNIPKIDLVICNLYPFEEVALDHPQNEQLMIENIDIGGPLMLRAAAKNYADVATLVDPSDYQHFIEQLRQGAGHLPLNYRKQLALKVWSHIAHYDCIISNELQRLWKSDGSLKQDSNSIELTPLPYDLRYGENPHQSAQIFVATHQSKLGFASANILQGKSLSYNNFLDADQAFKIVSEAKLNWPNKFAVSIIKHGNPCGFCVSASAQSSFERAWDSDPISRFGGVLAFSDEVTPEVAQILAEQFIEIIIAPCFSAQALTILAKKNNLRLIQMPLKNKQNLEMTYRSIFGAVLVQQEDEILSKEYFTVTQKKFSTQVLDLLPFAELCAKYLKSNAIALVGATSTGEWVLAGAGAGQPNRIDCFRQLAWPRFKEQATVAIEHCVLASDAFFPFRDMIDYAAQNGIQYILQPGGSLRDQEVIAACNQYGMAMAFSGQRHFRH